MRANSAERRDFLFVQSTTELGGAESVLLHLFESSAALRQRSVVVTLSFGDGDLPDRLRKLGVDVVELPRARLRDPAGVARTLSALRRIALDRGVQVIIGNGSHPQVLGGIASRLAGIRSAFIVHMIYAHPLWKNAPLDAIAIRGPCDLMLAVSRAALGAVQQLRPKLDTRLVYNGTPTRDVAGEDARQARMELGAREGDVLLGVFGRLQRWKGQDVFVEAAAQVARQRASTRFVVVGGSSFGIEPEYFDALKRRVAELDLTDRLVFTGYRKDVPRLMAACDVVCHTSRVPEPFGLVVIEAMMLGRAVIATAGGGPSEVIDSQDLGRLVQPDDPAALASTMMSLVDSADLRRSLGAAGAAHVRAHFTIDRMASEIVGHLDTLIRSR